MSLSDALAWLVVGTFVAVAVLEARQRRRAGADAGAGANADTGPEAGTGTDAGPGAEAEDGADAGPDLGRVRLLAAAGWALFGAFWLSVFPHFAFVARSPIEGTLSLLAAPACLSAAALLARGRDGPLVLTRAVAVMGLVYLPVETVPVVRRWLVETVAAQSHTVMTVAGFDPALSTGPDYGYRNRFVFVGPGGRELSTYVVTACTGVGSMSIFGGLVAAVRAPWRRRLRALAVAVGVIWVLNLLRNAFIAVAYGNQWFQQEPLVGVVVPRIYGEAYLTSYFVADRVISQSLAVLALVGVTLLVLREVPEVLAVLEEAAYVCTRREYDLGALLAVPGADPGRTARPDGGRVRDRTPGRDGGDDGDGDGNDDGDGNGGDDDGGPGTGRSGDRPGADRSNDARSDGSAGDRR